MNATTKLVPILLALTVLVSGCTSTPTQQYSTVETGQAGVGISVGNSAPEFTVTATDGRTIKLSDFSGKKPVMLYFMATWCPFCSKEYEEIQKVYPQYADKVELISVDLDLTENALVLEKYRVSKNRPGIFAIGNQNILINYDVVSTSTKYAISRDGVILYKGSGVQPANNWKIILDTLANS